jgi:hypothetical protein
MSLLSTRRERVDKDALTKLLELAVKRYNRYRGVESRARLLRVDNDTVIIAFEGSFCTTCGINDWVEDFKYVIEDLGGQAELVTVIEPDTPEEFYDYRIGVFKITKVPSLEYLRRIEAEELELEKYFSSKEPSG